MFMPVRAQHPPDRSRKKKGPVIAGRGPRLYNRGVGPAVTRLLLAAALLSCASSDVLESDGGAPDAAVGEGECGSRAQPRTFYVDDDDDGFGRTGDGAIHGCYEEPPAGFADNARDCDDDDGDKHEERYVDGDIDGYGVSTTARCVDHDEPGYADHPGDCDDEDQRRSPAEIEQWFDGVDQDCDGDEDPTGCFPVPWSESDSDSWIDEQFPIPPPIPIDRDDACDGADLYIAIASACASCGGGTATLIVANRGILAATYQVEGVMDTLEIETALAPQTASEAHVIEIRPLSSRIRIIATGDVGDCDLENNESEIEVPFVTCE
jgi:hypothetical protein